MKKTSPTMSLEDNAVYHLALLVKQYGKSKIKNTLQKLEESKIKKFKQGYLMVDKKMFVQVPRDNVVGQSTVKVVDNVDFESEFAL